MEQMDKNEYLEYLKGLKEKTLAIQENNAQAQIQDYNQYRVGIMYLIGNDEPDNYVCSQIEFMSDSVYHTLSIISNNSNQIVLQKQFNYDDTFRNYFFIPAFMDFVQSNRIIRTNINQLESGMVEYQCVSETDNIMIVSKIDRELAEMLDNNVKNIDYQEFEAKRKEEEYKKKANGNPYVYKISHYINLFIILILTGVVFSTLLKAI